MIGDVMKKLRTDAEMSQRTLGSKLGVSQQAIAQWEGGGREPDADTIKSIAKFFNVTVDYLMGNSIEEGNNLREVMAIDKKITLRFLQKLLEDTAQNKISWKRVPNDFEVPRGSNQTLSFYVNALNGIVFLFYMDQNVVSLTIRYSKKEPQTEISIPYDPQIQKATNDLYNLVYSKLPNIENFFEEYLASEP